MNRDGPEQTLSNAEAVACEFACGGQTCRGYFYRPTGEPPFPCVVMAHGFGASPEGPLGEMGRRLARAGISGFTFDYRHFGTSDGDPRLVLNMKRSLADWASAIAYVRGREEVDPARVGLWGSSLSGGQVLAIAARDPAVAAAVAQVPYVDGLALARAAGPRRLMRLLPAVGRDLLRALTRRPPYLVEGLGGPGHPAMVSVPPGLYETLADRAPGWRNQIAARSLLQVYLFRPIRHASAIRCPLLVVLTYKDGVAPSNVALRAAEELPYIELAMFQADHFDLYAGDAYDRAVRTEVRFFAHHFERARHDSEVPLTTRVTQTDVVGAWSGDPAPRHRPSSAP
jgi:pimeloyl-ACP methyl ester carboxylesterase